MEVWQQILLYYCAVVCTVIVVIWVIRRTI